MAEDQGRHHGRITITIEGGDAEEWVNLPKQLRHLHNQLGALQATQEKIMADLTTEFAALNAAFADLSTAIDTEIAQVLAAIAAGQDATAVVEDARTRINDLTSAVSAKVAALGADDPTPVG